MRIRLRQKGDMRIFFYRVLRYLGVLKHLRLNMITYQNERKIKIPVINEVGFASYVDLSEPWMYAILTKLLPHSEPNRFFVDVGVNLGQTLLKVKSISPEINYIGFEPNPICVNYLNTLIKVNKFSRTEIFPVGLGNKTSILKLALYSTSEVDSSASVVANFRDQESIVQTMNVPIFQFSDTHLESEIAFLKIDVEGAELEVIEGMYEKIKQDHPLILMEILPCYNKENSERINRQEKIQDIFRRLNYKILRVIKANDKFLGIEEMDEIEIHGDMNLCEYIFVHYQDKERVKIKLNTARK
jgi:FkbM family methyltransferase